MREDRPIVEEKERLFVCLNSLLSTAAMSGDKNLQVKQVNQIDKWFENKFEVVDYITKIPVFKQRHLQELQ